MTTVFTLTLGSTTTTIDSDWLDKGVLGRQPILLPTISRTPAGTPLIDGELYEPAHTWQLNFRLPSTRNTNPSYTANNDLWLQRILSESNRLRRTSPYTGYEITLIDEYELFEERSPRTRFKTAAAAIVDGSFTRYFSYFYVYPTAFNRVPDGAWNIWSLNLVELQKYPA